MADVSSWDNTLPSGDSEIRKGDDLLRTHWTDLENGWEEEHYWTQNSGASGGEHQPGSARVLYGNGPSATTNDEGRLFYDVDDNLLVLQGSSATTNLAGGVISAMGIKASADSLANGTSDVTWDAEDHDTDGMLDSSGTGSPDFTVPVAGIYRLECTVKLDTATGASGSSEAHLSIIDADSGTTYASSYSQAAALNARSATATVMLSANSKIKAVFVQDVNNNLNTSGDRTTHMSVTRIG